MREPGRIGLRLITRYTVVTLLGFAAAMLLPLSPEIALGFVIVACASGAVASNVIVSLAGGSVAYSVAVTMVSTFLSPVLKHFAPETARLVHPHRRRASGYPRRRTANPLTES